MAYEKKESLRGLQDKREKLFEDLRRVLKETYEAFNEAVKKRTPEAWTNWVTKSFEYESMYNELVKIEEKICILNTVANVSNIKEKKQKTGEKKNGRKKI